MNLNNVMFMPNVENKNSFQLVVRSFTLKILMLVIYIYISGFIIKQEDIWVQHIDSLTRWIVVP